MGEELVQAADAHAFAALSHEITALLEGARRRAARAVNALMTATYWEIGRRIVEFEQKGAERAEYGEHLLERLSADLTVRFGRGFSQRNLQQMRLFYLTWQIPQTLSAESTAKTIRQTLSDESTEKAIVQTVSAQFDFETLAAAFPLSWSHYVRLLSLRDEHARRFYETEALRGGWSLRQLERQRRILKRNWRRPGGCWNRPRARAGNSRQ